MSEVKWIKITTDIFNDEKMLLIESMPDSDSIIVIWFKLLSLAGKSNNGGLVMMSDKVPYTKDMLPILFRRKPTVVTLALHTFVEFGMIEILDNDTILISNWEKHQNVKGLESIREKNRIRQQRFRDNKNKLLENKELDKDIDIEGNVTRNVTHNIPYKLVIDYLNEKADTRYRSTTKQTQKYIKARFNDGFVLDDFYKVIEIKVNEWNNTDMAKFLRPETLFGTKFESYLNQPINKNDEIEDYFDKKERLEKERYSES